MKCLAFLLISVLAATNAGPVPHDDDDGFGGMFGALDAVPSIAGGAIKSGGGLGGKMAKQGLGIGTGLAEKGLGMGMGMGKKAGGSLTGNLTKNGLGASGLHSLLTSIVQQLTKIQKSCGNLPKSIDIQKLIDNVTKSAGGTHEITHAVSSLLTASKKLQAFSKKTHGLSPHTVKDISGVCKNIEGLKKVPGVSQELAKHKELKNTLKPLDCGKKLEKLSKNEDVASHIPKSVGNLNDFSKDLLEVKENILKGKTDQDKSKLAKLTRKLNLLKTVLASNSLQKKCPDAKLDELSTECGKASDILKGLNKPSGDQPSKNPSGSEKPDDASDDKGQKDDKDKLIDDEGGEKDNSKEDQNGSDNENGDDSGNDKNGGQGDDKDCENEDDDKTHGGQKDEDKSDDKGADKKDDKKDSDSEDADSDGDNGGKGLM